MGESTKSLILMMRELMCLTALLIFKQSVFHKIQQIQFKIDVIH